MRFLFFLIIFSLPCWGTIYLTVSGANVKRAKIAMGQVHPMGEAASADSQLAQAHVYDVLTCVGYV
jgi:hypothetical protein